MAEGASMRRFDAFFDRDWSFDPALRTPGFRKPKTRKRKPKAKATRPTFDEMIAELKRRGLL